MLMLKDENKIILTIIIIMIIIIIISLLVSKLFQIKVFQIMFKSVNVVQLFCRLWKFVPLRGS